VELLFGRLRFFIGGNLQTNLLATCFRYFIHIALNFRYASGPGTFPGGGGVGFIPSLHELVLRFSHFIAGVFRLHIEISPGNHPPCGLRRLHPVALYFHRARAESVGCMGQQSKVIILSGCVNRAYGRDQVVHIRLHIAVFQVGFFRAMACFECFAALVHASGSTLAPFFEVAPEVFSGHNMLPFYFGGAALVGCGFKPRGEVDVAFFVIGGGTIEGDLVVPINFC